MVRFKKRALKFEQPSGKKRRYYSFLTIVLLVCIAIILKSTFDNIVKIVAYQGKILEMQEYELGIDEKLINSSSPIKNLIYDLQGRRLQAALAKGLYIRGGKKYLVR